VAAITAVSLLQLSPTIVYRIVNGRNDEVAQRYWFESENYSLRLTNLLLPLDEHRIAPLAERKAEYVEQIPQNEGRAATLGVVGSIGFLWLLGVVAAAAVGAGRRHDFGLHPILGALTLVAVLVGTTGGLATLIAVVWPQIRAWNRLSVFIAFFALAAVALLLSWLERRLRAPVFAVVLAGVLAVGVFDQTSKAFVPPYDAIKAAWRHEQAYFSTLDDRLPSGAMVLELPYEPFPEPEPRAVGLYEPAKAYLHSDDLRWSWGAMRGRPEDWAARFADANERELYRAARLEGFRGILVDRLRYPDPASADAMETGLRGATGREPVRSPNGRYAFFPL
jgi:hypothetical protein